MEIETVALNGIVKLAVPPDLQEYIQVRSRSVAFYRIWSEDKKEDYDKSPYNNRNVKRAKWQHKQRHKKVRLNSNCGPT